MNKEQYKSDTRYEKVFHNMELLGIVDITTNRQHRNGTVVWRLPIKNNNSGKTLIEVASFSTGYVRNQNSGYSNYQLNKRCDSEPQYYKSINKNGDYDKDWCDRPLYTQFTTRSCVLIPEEIDRLEYLISYCLKNYYIKNANQVADGKYVDKWYHEWKLKEANETYSENTGAMARIEFLQSDVDEQANTIIKLEEKLFDITEKYNSYKNEYKNRASEVNDLQNKLATIKRIADYETI